MCMTGTGPKMMSCWGAAPWRWTSIEHSREINQWRTLEHGALVIAIQRRHNPAKISTSPLRVICISVHMNRTRS